MRHRVELQQKSQARDSIGQQSSVFTAKATVWASIEPTKGSEVWSSHKLSNEIETTIKIRFQRDIDESWRIYQPATGMTWGILGIIRPYAIRRELWLGCTQRPMGEPAK